MQEHVNKPIFVVGSPRSGTSILTWCLGQHPNMFPVPESNWMGRFAVQAAVSFRVGSERGAFSILNAMDIPRDEFLARFGHTINEMVLGHREDLVKRRTMNPSAYQSRTRWVDGTPEYSFYIYGLRALFPGARFIHIVRDVESVVRSMLNFERAMGIRLVATEEEAYQSWLRSVRACVAAERAYGPTTVLRLQYADLIDQPEGALRSLLEFLNEPYDAKCLGPLAQKMNSSNVPSDFESHDPATDHAVVEDATRLSQELEANPQPPEASPVAAKEMEAGFAERVQYMATLDDQYQKALETIRKLEPAKNAETARSTSR